MKQSLDGECTLTYNGAMSEVLTEKQEAVFKFIEEYQLQHGSSPTLREMREYFGVSSDNSILKHLKALKDKGYIQKNDTPRGIKLLSNVKERLQSTEIKLPLLGMIPAGGPVLSEEYIEKWLNVGKDVVYKVQDSYLLRVTGTSMINAGIHEGDILVVCGALEPRSGDIVVALVDGQNTVKRYINDGSEVYLKAENPEYENIYPEGELCIQGVVTGLLRYYKR